MTVTRKRPDVTRLVTAADGQGTTREVYGWLTAVSVEATWPDPELRYGPREKFVEARNAASYLDHKSAARDELAKGRGGTTIDLDLAETPTRQWGRDWLLGDTITVVLPDGTTVNDRITQVQIVANATDGVRITPKVGDTNATTNPDLARELALTGVIRELSRTQRR